MERGDGLFEFFMGLRNVPDMVLWTISGTSYLYIVLIVVGALEASPYQQKLVWGCGCLLWFMGC